MNISKMFTDYIGDKDWKINENSNMQKSVNGLNNYIREEFTKQYWLNDIYPKHLSKFHREGLLHIHDLGALMPYCNGWDIKQLLLEGFKGASTKVESAPAKHFRSALGQIVNATFVLQGESAGAQAWSSFDTYLAPFVSYDRLSYEQVKQGIQEFVFNLNVPTRVGFQTPFSNLTFDIKVPNSIQDDAVVIGGEYQQFIYKDFQAEMDMINKAFCEVMLEGDANGRVFTFPIPTSNITKDFDWNNPVITDWMKITNKYGIPYFANYVNSDMSPDDSLSMCCRLRLDTSSIRRRGGLFNSNPLTGSIGVVTLNLPRIAYESSGMENFKDLVKDSACAARDLLEIKRNAIEDLINKGMYPYSAFYLKDVKNRFGSYYYNHFSTIGIVGMNEALLNLFDISLASEEGKEIALDILEYIANLTQEFSGQTGNLYNFEATPAEGISYKLALADKQACPDIVTAGDREPYYTNSSQLPVGHTDNIWELLDHQDELQQKYTGGTVQHIYLGESIEDTEVTKRFIQTVFNKYKLPYISITPTFSICQEHGYINGEHFNCPKCGETTEVWSRVTGFLRPVQNWNKGKKEEFRQRSKMKGV